MMKLVLEILQALWVKEDSFQSEEICNMKMPFRMLIININSQQNVMVFFAFQIFSTPSVYNFRSAQVFFTTYLLIAPFVE
jgi:hypothetical protein